MPREVTKKRKLGAATSGPSVAGSTPKEVKKLQNDLKRCNASDIIQSLSDTLGNISHEDLQTLKRILDPLLKTDAKPKHCARCHQSFREAENMDKSCVVRCGSPESTGYQDQEYEHYRMMQTPCCNKLLSEFGLEDMDSGDEDLVCYRTKHTADPKMVKYYKSHDEVGGELNYSGWDKSIRTCKAMGCGKQAEKGGRQAKRRKRASTSSDDDY